MTRINVVPPRELSDKHLGAEYRELPRIFGLVRVAQSRGWRAADPRYPADYVLGRGHVLFFYPRLSWLCARYDLLVQECRRRQRVVNFPSPDTSGIADEWFGGYIVTPEALALNRQRIKLRS